MTDGPIVHASETQPASDRTNRDWPSVTVLLPTHNRPQLLPGTVQSILDQRYAGRVEVLVVFDREEPVRPDVTVPANRELTLLTNERTPGPAGGYNTGALVATGDYLALCDDDDEWLPDKLRLQIEAMERHPGALLATCGVYLGDGRTLTRHPTRIPKHEVLPLDLLLKAARNEIHSSTLLVRRTRMMDEVGLIDEDIPASYGEDYDWILRAARVAPVIAVRKPLVRVRWGVSYFADRWPAIIDALTYQLDRRPELKEEPANLARIYGRLAFAHAASGHKAEARQWARRAIKRSWRQPRPYLAYLVTSGVLRPETVARIAHAVGRGV